MTDKAISPLRQRMIEDMEVRDFTPCTQRGYLAAVREFTVFLGRSPDQATIEDLRRFQHQMRTQGASAATMNTAVSALRFFFGTTLGRGDAEVGMTTVRLPQRLPVILSPDEVARLLEHAPGLKARAALSVAYGAGLRASEVVSLKVTDIDSERRVIRVEQGKGRKDRYAMLADDLLALLRDWWRLGHDKGVMLPGGWLFPGQNPVNPMTTRQLGRIFHGAKDAAGIDKRVSLHTLRHCFATHLLERKVDIRVIQVLLGHARLNTTAHYSQVDSRTLNAVKSPLSLLPSTAGRKNKAPQPGGLVPKQRLEVQDIFRACGPAWRKANAGHISLGQLKVMAAIEHCRTAALGGHVAACEDCGHILVAYNSCRNRHCPKCQGAAARDWLAARQAELLPVPYYHVVFTLPAAIADIAYHNKAHVYGILFAAASETLLTIAADPKHLGARIGITAVLHSWGSAMTHHPHVHCIVPGGGISPDGSQWVACRPGFFLPVRVLSRLFRRVFLDKLTAAHDGGSLLFFGEHGAPADHNQFAALLAPLRTTEWVVYAKPPFAGPDTVLAYLSRYTHRVAISNSRLLAFDGQSVTFKWKDYRATGRHRQKIMTLEASEFIRRFLLHVLPRRFHRIRHYGLFANGGRAENLARARELLNAEPAHGAETSGEHHKHGNDGAEPPPCPVCGGTMILIDTFAPAQLPRSPKPRAPPTAKTQAA